MHTYVSGATVPGQLGEHVSHMRSARVAVLAAVLNVFGFEIYIDQIL